MTLSGLVDEMLEDIRTNTCGAANFGQVKLMVSAVGL
jgi:hypothetical protein